MTLTGDGWIDLLVVLFHLFLAGWFIKSTYDWREEPTRGNFWQTVILGSALFVIAFSVAAVSYRLDAGQRMTVDSVKPLPDAAPLVESEIEASAEKNQKEEVLQQEQDHKEEHRRVQEEANTYIQEALERQRRMQ